MQIDGGSIVKLRQVLRDAPATIPALGALAVFVIWARSDAGYPVTHWAPGGLILLALLAITLWVLPLRLGEVPVAVRVAVACLALYTALSYLSILWAQVPGDAWEGANRTLLYLIVFALFALWPQRALSAALLLGIWVVAMIALAAFVLLHVDSSANPAALFSEGRLKYPSDYENACAALWCMVLWPALLLAAGRNIPWAVRGLLAGGAVLLADLALLSQSRGSLFATVVMIVLVFALVPGRVRTFLILVPVAAAVGAAHLRSTAARRRRALGRARGDRRDLPGRARRWADRRARRGRRGPRPVLRALARSHAQGRRGDRARVARSGPRRGMGGRR
jgi:hypothetical protein